MFLRLPCNLPCYNYLVVSGILLIFWAFSLDHVVLNKDSIPSFPSLYFYSFSSYIALARTFHMRKYCYLVPGVSNTILNFHYQLSVMFLFCKYCLLK